jgi:dienelactone hydrolase
MAISLALVGCATARGGLPRVGEVGGPQECAAGQYLRSAFERVSVKRGVAYSRPSDEYGAHRLRMDIYRPKGDALRIRPAIVWVHGGAFKMGDRAQLSELAKQFALRGYISVAIDYRLLRVPDPLAGPSAAADISQSDAQSAIRFLRSHAAEYGIDPQRIAIAGYSAGSITAFHVGYRHEFTGDNTDNPDSPHTVSAVVGLDGFLIKPEDMEPDDPPFALFRSTERDNPGVEPRRGRENPGAFDALFARADELRIPWEVHDIKGATHRTLVRRPHLRAIMAGAAPFLRRFLACPGDSASSP